MSLADLGNAKAWMRDDSLRHRYEQMRNGVEQIRAEGQRQSPEQECSETQRQSKVFLNERRFYSE